MADRVTNWDAVIYADILGATSATVTITDPSGTDVASAQAATAVGHARFSYTIPVISPEGVWVAVWTGDNSRVVRQEFTVGRSRWAGATKYQALCQALGRVSLVHYGQLADVGDNSFADPLLTGGYGSRQGYYLRVAPDPLTPGLLGRTYRVEQLNGTAITVQPYFHASAIPDGLEYALTNIPWDEASRGLDAVIREIAPRVPITVSLSVPSATFTDTQTSTSRTQAIIPETFRTIHRVDYGGTTFSHTDWSLLPGRVLVLPATVTAGQPVTITGCRFARPPLWDDSELDFDAGAVSAHVAGFLHAARARGQGVDPDAHASQVMLGYQEGDAKEKLGITLPKPGTRQVLA